MAWNTPGSSGNNGSGGNGSNNNPWRRNTPSGGGGGGFNALIERLRELFSGGGGNPLRWVGLAVLLLLVLSSFQLIGEQQRGVVLRFGKFARVMQPGPNFKWPWPVESVQKVNATEIKTFSNTVPVLTSDENIVSVTLNVQYRINDPYLYLYGTRSADEMLKQSAQSAVREQVGRSDLESVLNKRGPLAAAARTRLQGALDAYKTGLVVTGLTLPNARPPDQVKPAFDEVNGAQQVRERLVNEANAYAAKVVPESRGEAARTRTQAEGYKEAVIANAQGDAERFTLLQKQYANAPDTTRKRLWLETVEKVLASNRKVIGADGRQLIYVPMQPGQAAPQQSGSNPPVMPPQTYMQPATGSSDSTTVTPMERPARPAGREETTR
ncbi:FtsH protease activity modulator HflK [Pseudoxanthomonas composti]|uniref:Protein HflK n=1 Tax=Pseudoxanthomonas composti TaxID=2137479 RepID=A0A4Q1JWN7_9GAMM|nr:FtsH protease activity modulator HflK [Pseudoxanthomonas composti]RXR05323.1 FtsH protease activity modulator HflK [Pseudoxanthomonas composti]